MIDNPIQIDEGAESWITLMMGLESAKTNASLRKEFEEKLSPEVLQAADECTSYENFKQLLKRYRATEENENGN